MNKGEPHLREADNNGQERPVVPATPSHFHSDNSCVLTLIVSSSHVYGAYSTILFFSPSVPLSSPVAHTSQAHCSQCPSSAVSSPCDTIKEDDKKNESSTLVCPLGQYFYKYCHCSQDIYLSRRDVETHLHPMMSSLLC